MIAPDLHERIVARLQREPAIVADLAAEFSLPISALEGALRALRVDGRVRALQRGIPPVVTWEVA